MKKFDEEKIVKRELDKISHAGESLGHFLKEIVRMLRRFAWVIAILSGVGLIVFLWSVFIGLRKKD